MIIKQDSDMTPQPVTTDGAADVTIRIPIGPDDGSENMIMRLFCIAPGGHTPAIPIILNTWCAWCPDAGPPSTHPEQSTN